MNVKTVCTAAVLLCASVFSHAESISISVDLREAPRNIYHARLTFPVKPGPLTLVYPQWIPGNHRPSGPIANLVGLRMEAGDHEVLWERDPVDPYAFHLNVPEGAKELHVWLDAITNSGVAGSSGAAASTNVLDLTWNQVVLYPQGANSDAVMFKTSVELPAGWKYGTALSGRVNAIHNPFVQFDEVSLTTLVDSPLIAGDHYKQIQLTGPGETPVHVIDMVGESDAALVMTSQDEASYRKLVAETGALFGARHYTQYHFLLTLSDEVGGRGLEHHESSDNGMGEHGLTDPDIRLMEAGLLPHEFTHSWNGKYRRPAGLATKNYQEPMKGDLLWVYEGLTTYLGGVLAVRTGLLSPEQYRESLADTAADLDHEPGRSWRSLEDTTRSVEALRLIPPAWYSWRRNLDYYPEGDLIWLEVDTLIRKQSQGNKSLDDFCRLFFGGQSGPPQVVPYTFEDVVKALNQVVPYDWSGLLKQRVDAINANPPLNGITQGGWRLVYNDQPNSMLKIVERFRKSSDLAYSLGLRIGEEGRLVDVVYGSPAYMAGLGPGMKIIAVNGRKYSPGVLAAAIKDAKLSSPPIELLAENADFIKPYSIDYHDGVREPHLERGDGPDLIGEILKPLTK